MVDQQKIEHLESQPSLGGKVLYSIDPQFLMTLGSKACKEQSECPPPCKPHQVHTHRTFSVLPHSGVDVSSLWVANRHVRQRLLSFSLWCILGDGFDARFLPFGGMLVPKNK